MKTNDKPLSRQTLYQIISRHSRAAVEQLVKLMYSANENVSLGACKTLLNKTIPDLERQELDYGENKKLLIEIVEDTNLKEYKRTA